MTDLLLQLVRMTMSVVYTKLQKLSALIQTRPNIILQHIMRLKRVCRDCKFSNFNILTVRRMCSLTTHVGAL